MIFYFWLVIKRYFAPRDDNLCNNQAKNLALYKQILTCDSIASLLQHDNKHCRPYLLNAQRPILTQALLPIITKLTGEVPTTGTTANIAQNIASYLAIEETVAYDRLLQLLKIPYQGIERSSTQHQAFTQQSQLKRSFHFFQENEANRITHMTDRIFKNALPQLNNNSGVIIYHVGCLHTQQLAANIIDYSKKIDTDYDIKVVPMFCVSNYSEDTLKPNIQIIRNLQANYPPHLKAVCQNLFTPLVRIRENEGNVFQSEAFEQAIGMAIEHVAPEKMYLSEYLRETTPEMLTATDIGFKPSRSCCPTWCTIM